MARLPRFNLPGYPQHVIQRGNNRQPILFDEADYWLLWETLCAATRKFRCEIHAYCLMPNHFHLLLTPSQEDSIGKLMQFVGRYYVQYFNRRYDRTGTLWEGRYRATLLDPNAYLIPCSHYVEANPVRAELVSDCMDYGWSSHLFNATGREDALITPHRQYISLGRTRKAQRTAYKKACQHPLNEQQLTRIREATNKAWVLGEDPFCNDLEGRINRRPSPRPRGGDRRSIAYRCQQLSTTN